MCAIFNFSPEGLLNVAQDSKYLLKSFKVSTLLFSTICIEEKCLHITRLYRTHLEYFVSNRCGLGHT